MAGELNNSTLADFVKLGEVMWHKGVMEYPQVARTSGIWREVPIPQGTGNTREFSEIDPQLYADTKDEGDQANRAAVQQGYSKTMTQKRVALNIGITYEMRTMNKYPEVVSRLEGSGKQVARRMELDLQHRLGFAASTSYVDRNGNVVDTTLGDTLALASSVHTLRGSATTYRNVLANNPRLSKGSLEAIERLAVEETYNQFGEKIPEASMMYDILWTTDDPNTVNTAREYLQSTSEISAPNAGVVNVYRSKYRHVILPLVATTAVGATDTSKRYFWGLASSQYGSAYLGIWEESRLIPPTAGTNAEDVQTDDWDFRVRGGYGICWVSARGLLISYGDGQA